MTSGLGRSQIRFVSNQPDRSAWVPECFSEMVAHKSTFRISLYVATFSNKSKAHIVVALNQDLNTAPPPIPAHQWPQWLHLKLNNRQGPCHSCYSCYSCRTDMEGGTERSKKIASIYSSQPQWLSLFLHTISFLLQKFKHFLLDIPDTFWTFSWFLLCIFRKWSTPGGFQVFPGKNLGKTQTKNGLSLPRAASLRLTTVTATESLSLASVHPHLPWHHCLFFFGEFTLPVPLHRFWILINQMIDLKRMRDETSPGTWGEKEIKIVRLFWMMRLMMERGESCSSCRLVLVEARKVKVLSKIKSKVSKVRLRVR